MEAIAKAPTNGTPPNVERDPAYPTWEAERTALVLRREELHSLIEQFDPSSADAAYDEMQRDGFDDAHCQEKADAILTEHQSMRSEIRGIDTRLSLIKPLLNLERNALISKSNKGEYQERLLGSLERIAAALESMAGQCDGNGRKRQAKAGAA